MCMIQCPKARAKAQKFWAAKTELRKQKGRCGRCAQPFQSEEYRHCQACRDYSARRREEKRVEPVTVDNRTLAALERRVAALEQSLTMSQLAGRVIYRKAFSRGLSLAKTLTKKAVARMMEQEEKATDYFGAFPEITKQELSTMNHAYESDR
jgi:hypothetical protein